MSDHSQSGHLSDQTPSSESSVYHSQGPSNMEVSPAALAAPAAPNPPRNAVKPSIPVSKLKAVCAFKDKLVKKHGVALEAVAQSPFSNFSQKITRKIEKAARMLSKLAMPRGRKPSVDPQATCIPERSNTAQGEANQTAHIVSELDNQPTLPAAGGVAFQDPHTEDDADSAMSPEDACFEDDYQDTATNHYNNNMWWQAIAEPRHTNWCPSPMQGMHGYQTSKRSPAQAGRCNALRRPKAPTPRVPLPCTGFTSPSPALYNGWQMHQHRSAQRRQAFDVAIEMHSSEDSIVNMPPPSATLRVSPDIKWVFEGQERSLMEDYEAGMEMLKGADWRRREGRRKLQRRHY